MHPNEYFMIHTLKNLFRFANGLQVILNRLLFIKTGPTVYSYGDLTFLVDHKAGDQDGPRACVIPGLYDPFLEVIGAKDELTFLDLGANAGGFILSLLKNRRTVGEGVAVELNPVTWSRLIYNVFANVPDAHGKMSILNGAVSRDDGFLDIRLGGGGVGDNVNGSPDGTPYHLPCHTLESLVERFRGKELDIIKIDIEGSEFELLGTQPEILRSARYILIEIHEIPGRKGAEVREWIEMAGFSEIAPSRKPLEDNVFLFRRD